MRRGLLFYVLMVVLVLRGLMGTAMAAGALPMQHAPAPTAAAAHHHDHLAEPDTAHTTDHGAAADHGLHAAMANGSHGATGTALQTCGASHDDSTGCATHNQHANCTACEICHSALLEPPAMPAAREALATGAAPAATTPFDSATAALAIKPPIAA